MGLDSNNSKNADKKAARDNADSAKKPLSGFRRTLSTELLEKEIEVRALKEFNALIESRTYEIDKVTWVRIAGAFKHLVRGSGITMNG